MGTRVPGADVDSTTQIRDFSVTAPGLAAESSSPNNAVCQSPAPSSRQRHPMLRLSTTGKIFCDGISRRDWLRLGSLSPLALSLPRLLSQHSSAAEATVRHPSSFGKAKRCVILWMGGGPAQQDTFDLKPEAPREIAGPWQPIATSVPGFEICEAFPRLATMADKFTVIRSLVGNQNDHDAIQVFNGHDPRKPKPSGGWPQFGTMVSKVQGAARPESPCPTGRGVAERSAGGGA